MQRKRGRPPAGPAPGTPDGRPLSFAERMVDVDGRMSWNGIAAARLAGACDREAFRAALDALQHRHPVLGARVERRGGVPRVVPMPAPPPIELRVLARRDRGHWLTLLEAELAEPLDPDAGRMARLTLLADAEGFDALLVVHHVACNGRSRMALLGALLRLAGDPAARAFVAAAPPVAPAASLETLIGAPIRAGLAIRAAARAASPLLALLAWRVRRRRHAEPAPVHVTAWTVDAASDAAMRAAGRAEGVTPAAMVATACLRASRAERGTAALNRIACSVDIAARLPGLPPGDLVSVADWVDLALPAGDGGFWDQARTVKAALDRGVATLDVARKTALGETLHRSAGAILTLLVARRPYQDLTLSHLGTVDLEAAAMPGVPAPAPDAAPPFRVERVLGSLATFPWRNTSFLFATRHAGEVSFFLVGRAPHLTREAAAALARRIEAILARQD